MKKLKLFFALFAMLALGVGNAWGAEKITDYSKIVTGKTYYIGATTGGTDYYLSVSGAATSTSIAGTAKTDKANATAFVFTGSGTSWTIKFTDYANYLGLKSSKDNGKVQVVSSAATFTASNQSEKLRLSIGSYSIQKNNSGTQFGSYGNTQTDIWLEEVPGSSEPTTQYTIKWHTAKGVTTDVTLSEGATITKPATEPTMTGYEFMGWTDQCNVATDGVGFTPLTNFGTADSDIDFYAVFAVAETTGGGGSSNYEKVTSNLADWAGDYLIAYNNTTFADGRTGGTSGMGAQNKKVDLSSKISNNAIPASVGDQYNVTLEAVSGGYVLKTKDGNYNYQSNNANGLTTTKTIATAASYAINVTFTSENDIKLALTGSAAGAVFRYNTQGYFRFYKNGGQSAVYLYKKTSGGGSTTTYSNYITTCSGSTPVENLTGAQFAWSAATAEATMGASNTFPILTNTLPVSVTYESSTPATATIAADGTITLVAPGTTTISAKFAGGEVSGTTYAAKTVKYDLTVLKAPATPTENVYVKVIETAGITDGEYLIVYEDAEGNPKAPVAFNGSLTTLDAVGNNIDVTINSNTIAGNSDIDKATFTLDVTNGTILSASGKYIGVTSYDNGLKQNAESSTYGAHSFEISEGNAIVKIVIADKGDMILNYNPSTNNGQRFRYYKEGSQKPIALYKKVDPSEILAPAFSVAAGSFYDAQSVVITCATPGAEIYYTLDGSTPSSTSTKYTSAVAISETKTLKAIAIKGGYSSSVTEATYTILAPLATMQEIFDKAKAVGTTATPVKVTMNNWVVTGVKNNNVYVTDGTKGLIIYTASHGFVVGDVLSGTVACKVQLYNGSSELTELTNTTEGLTVTTGGTVTPVVVTDITTLGGVNSGSVIKITGPCTVDGTKYYVAGVQLFNSLYAYTNPEDGYNYECTGVYLQYNTTKEILPRKAEDLVKIETQQPAGIKFETTEYTANVNEAFTAPTLTNPNSLTVTYSTSDATLATVNTNTGAVTIGNKTGKVTITASFAGNEDYVAATASYNITISDPNQLEATFVAGTDKSDTKSISKNGITVEFADGSFSRDDNYRCYAGKSMTISYADGNITKIVIECTANDGAEYGPGQFTTETATYSYSGKVGTWTGEANSVTFTNIKQVRMTAITVYYKQDNRADAELAWNPATISLTVGNAFTAPTFSNPNSVTGITFTSDNEALATVDNAGAISLVSGKTGTATITATYAGNEFYKAAEVTCVITVSPKSEKVVILAQYNGQWYALKNVEETAGKVLAALEVTYFNGTLYNVADADKATIEWQRAAVTDGIIFKNGENYIYGTEGSTDLKLSTTECAWTLDGSTYKIGNRTFIYRAQANGFKNYNAEDNAGTADYSALPVVTAPVYATGDIVYTRDVTPGNLGTICLPFNVPAGKASGATFYTLAGMDANGRVAFDEVTGELAAGVPYLFQANAAEIVCYCGTTSVLSPDDTGAMKGTFVNLELDGSDLTNIYYFAKNALWSCVDLTKLSVPANRAYVNMAEVTAITGAAPVGVRRITLGVNGQNTATSVDQVQGDEVPTKMIINGQLFILRGEKTYDAQGKLVK